MSWKNSDDVEFVSRIIFPILEGYANSDNEQHQIYYKQCLRWPCRYLERFIAPEASKNAQLKALEMGLGDLRQYTWGSQKKEMKGVFLWEHVYPVSSMVKALLELDNPSLQSVSDIVSKADIAWVLKTEDQLLTKNGFRSKRPENPWDAYVQSGIDIAA